MFSKKVERDDDYVLTVADIEEFEAKCGQIPEGSFIAMRPD